MPAARRCDRTSNGPHIYYPNPRGAGGTGTAEDWVMENFNCDPLGGHTMLQTAENVAAQYGVSRADQDAFALRSQQKATTARAEGRPSSGAS